ncbi:replication termination factor 2 [Leptidea sinapis]|uniref:replication termination factor 2 n=1 Tax=Leptidea sinapis TaxID=189913 RepID=UPI00212C1F7E|nr:replication termination factor 2 [Leptidea sinapis]
MGCDGGTIPRRDELVRLKKKPEQKDKDAERSNKWRNCALSQQPLQEPIVACGLGKLYSKSVVLEALLDKESKPESIGHIKNLKDIKDLKLTKNPAHKATEHTDGAVGDGSAPFICPISLLEMSGKFRFVFLWSCGCVLAERALKEVKQNLCHMCQQPFTDKDVVVINGNEEDIVKLQERMAERVASRKTKKIKAEKIENVETKETELSVPSGDASNIKVKAEEPTASCSQVKKEADTIPLSLPKFNPNKQPRGFLGPTKRAFPNGLGDPSYKKSKKDYSVAKDPQSSEVYKSLFTSHKNEQEQQRAHWVTYNPFYN